jgi:hypothetical protein
MRPSGGDVAAEMLEVAHASEKFSDTEMCQVTPQRLIRALLGSGVSERSTAPPGRSIDVRRWCRHLAWRYVKFPARRKFGPEKRDFENHRHGRVRRAHTTLVQRPSDGAVARRRHIGPGTSAIPRGGNTAAAKPCPLRLPPARGSSMGFRARTGQARPCARTTRHSASGHRR